jgi:hypothetical protein
MRKGNHQSKSTDADTSKVLGRSVGQGKGTDTGAVRGKGKGKDKGKVRGPKPARVSTKRAAAGIPQMTPSTSPPTATQAPTEPSEAPAVPFYPIPDDVDDNVSVRLADPTNDKWTCRKCTLENEGGVECLACGTHNRRPKSTLWWKVPMEVSLSVVERLAPISPANLKVGMLVAARDSVKKWYRAEIVEIVAADSADGKAKCKVSFENWPLDTDEWIDSTSGRLRVAPPKEEDGVVAPVASHARSAATSSKAVSSDGVGGGGNGGRSKRRGSSSDTGGSFEATVSSAFYTVELLLEARVLDGVRQVKVKWLGFPHSDNSWEPVKHLPPREVARFEQQQRLGEVPTRERSYVHHITTRVRYFCVHPSLCRI